MGEMTNAEKFCKLNGIKPIMGAYTAGAYQYDYPDFDAKSILEVMDKRPDGKLFYAHLMYSGDNVEAIDDDGYIDRDYIKNPDKLLEVAVEWCEEHNVIDENERKYPTKGESK